LRQARYAGQRLGTVTEDKGTGGKATDNKGKAA
jgi:hypothetical protein